MTSASMDTPTAPSTRLPQLEIVLGAHVERIQQRDLESFDEIYRLTRDEVARILFHLSAPGADLEKLVGDAYVMLLDVLRGLPAGAPVRPAILRTCTKVALQRPPLFGRRAPRALDLDPSAGSTGRSAQAAHLLHQALGRLPAMDRAVFVLGEVLGLSAKEVQAATGLSQGAADSHLRRARLALTETLRFADEADSEVAS